MIPSRDLTLSTAPISWSRGSFYPCDRAPLRPCAGMSPGFPLRSRIPPEPRNPASLCRLGLAWLSLCYDSCMRRLSSLKVLVGSGDKTGLFMLPFLIGGFILNVAYPSLFDVGGPSSALRMMSILVLLPGVTIWIWSVVLILTKVPRGELITSGPYSLVKHPLYTVWLYWCFRGSASSSIHG
jgi:hypothetical protein